MLNLHSYPPADHFGGGIMDLHPVQRDFVAQCELQEAGIPVLFLAEPDPYTETHCKAYGLYKGWVFKRTGAYWTAEHPEGLSDHVADLIWSGAVEGREMKYFIRVNGDCACRSPKFWRNCPADLRADSYHIDNQLGLNTFVKFLE